MKPAMKVIMFFVFIFLIGMVYKSLNDWGIQPVQEAYDNSSLADYHYDNINTVFDFSWLAIPIIAVVGLAIYLAVERTGGI